MERYMYVVDRNEKEVQYIHNNIMNTFEANFIGPAMYLNNYQKYLYILNGTAEKDLNDFFAMDPLPYLKVTIIIKRDVSLLNVLYFRNFQGKLAYLKS